MSSRGRLRQCGFGGFSVAAEGQGDERHYEERCGQLGQEYPMNSIRFVAGVRCQFGENTLGYPDVC